MVLWCLRSYIFRWWGHASYLDFIFIFVIVILLTCVWIRNVFGWVCFVCLFLILVLRVWIWFLVCVILGFFWLPFFINQFIKILVKVVISAIFVVFVVFIVIGLSNVVLCDIIDLHLVVNIKWTMDISYFFNNKIKIVGLYIIKIWFKKILFIDRRWWWGYSIDLGICDRGLIVVLLFNRLFLWVWLVVTILVSFWRWDFHHSWWVSVYLVRFRSDRLNWSWDILLVVQNGCSRRQEPFRFVFLPFWVVLRFWVEQSQFMFVWFFYRFLFFLDGWIKLSIVILNVFLCFCIFHPWAWFRWFYRRRWVRSGIWKWQSWVLGKKRWDWRWCIIWI